MAETKEETLVDPRVREAREHFDKMIESIRKMSPDEYRKFGVEAGFLNEDGSAKIPEGEPCVSGSV
jgi:hypothetical protein